MQANKGLNKAIMFRKQTDRELELEREREVLALAAELRREELLYVKKTRK